MATPDDVRPVYEELKGYLLQAPAGDKHQLSEDPTLWEPANQAIDELVRITGDNTYERMKIVPEFTTQFKSGRMVRIASYRGALGGVVSRLYGEYFSDEDEPFREAPDQVISVSQEQKTEVIVTMVFEMQEQINELLNDPDLPPEEKKFLEKLKSGLSTVKNVVELIRLILTTSRESGIDLDSLSELFR